MKKIYNIDQLKIKISQLKKEKKKIVHCHGVFDLLHVGHVKHFQTAKSLGDYLIVTLTSDKYVNKGPSRPIFNQDLRCEFISSLSCVDAVCISDYQTSETVIKIIKPNFYFKGPDYKVNKNDKTKNIYKEINLVKKFHGKIKYSKDEVFSSSQLINKYLISSDTDQNLFSQKLSRKFSNEYIEQIINKFKNLKVLLIGETIIDQYVFCEVLGKSGKEPNLVISDKSIENYLGGAGAIANHLSTFCKKIEFITYVGEQNNKLNFIKKNIKKNISFKPIYKKNSPTILKKRYLDQVSGSKLLGVYSLNDKDISISEEKKIISKLDKIIKDIDLIIISDYGHGLITKKIVKKLKSSKKFLALNAQVNASNHGFHSLEKYKKIDTLIINENELRHEMRDKLDDINIISSKLMKKFGIENLIVTRGKNGALLFKKNKKPILCPAFATKIIDKVGAGDNMLSIMSLCLFKKMDPSLSLYIGSLAGALSVESIGNKEHLIKSKLLRAIEYSLK
jgi:rfaE bifunctional protein kinase chain/domain/rfaE bifunctional protein nucleotidyltransferase chain/domain